MSDNKRSQISVSSGSKPCYRVVPSRVSSPCHPERSETQSKFCSDRRSKTEERSDDGIQQRLDQSLCLLTFLLCVPRIGSITAPQLKSLQIKAPLFNPFPKQAPLVSGSLGAGAGAQRVRDCHLTSLKRRALKASKNPRQRYLGLKVLLKCCRMETIVVKNAKIFKF